MTEEFYLTDRSYSSRYYHSESEWIWDLAMKRYSIFPKASGLPTHHQIEFNVLTRILIGVCVCVCVCVGGGSYPSEGEQRHVQQPQLTGWCVRLRVCQWFRVNKVKTSWPAIAAGFCQCRCAWSFGCKSLQREGCWGRVSYIKKFSEAWCIKHLLGPQIFLT